MSLFVFCTSKMKPKVGHTLIFICLSAGTPGSAQVSLDGKTAPSTFTKTSALRRPEPGSTLPSITR